MHTADESLANGPGHGQAAGTSQSAENETGVATEERGSNAVKSRTVEDFLSACGFEEVSNDSEGREDAPTDNAPAGSRLMTSNSDPPSPPPAPPPGFLDEIRNAGPPISLPAEFSSNRRVAGARSNSARSMRCPGLTYRTLVQTTPSKLVDAVRRVFGGEGRVTPPLLPPIRAEKSGADACCAAPRSCQAFVVPCPELTWVLPLLVELECDTRLSSEATVRCEICVTDIGRAAARGHHGRRELQLQRDDRARAENLYRSQHYKTAFGSESQAQAVIGAELFDDIRDYRSLGAACCPLAAEHITHSEHRLGTYDRNVWCDVTGVMLLVSGAMLCRHTLIAPASRLLFCRLSLSSFKFVVSIRLRLCAVLSAGSQLRLRKCCLLSAQVCLSFRVRAVIRAGNAAMHGANAAIYGANAEKHRWKY
eukprot:1366215-Rhodomonas_salina.2